MNRETREPSRLPVRGLVAAAVTVGASALLLSFRGGPLAPAPAVLGAGSEPPAAETAPMATEDVATAAQTEPSSAAIDTGAVNVIDDVSAETTTSDTGEPGSVPVTTGATAEMVTATDEIMTATGDPVAIRWGEVQVSVAVAGGDIIDVETLAIPSGDRRSQRINGYAEPILREEAIAYDTADVSVVSGATYTSRAYAASLQSALDQLGA